MNKASVRRLVVMAVVLALVSMVARSYSAFAEWDSDPLNTQLVLRHHYLCGVNDLPEEGIQGDVSKADQDSRRAEKGYNCGLALVGHATLDHGGRPATGNANMAWAGSCAYVAGPGGGIAPQMYTPPAPENGVAVVDVHDSAHPKHIATLHSPGAAAVSETINAVTTPSGRSILVVGQYGNDVVSQPKPMSIYDVSNPDCSRFKLMGTYYWPANIHNLTLSQDGKYVFATIPLQAADISGLWNTPPTPVKYLGNIQDAMDGPPVATGPSADLDDNLPAAVRSQTHPTNSSHEAWPSPDDNTLYVGGQTPQYEIFSIIDLSQWLQRNPDGTPKGKPVMISQQSGRGHSVRTATIGGKPFVLHSEESVFGTAYGCIPETANPFAGPAQPWLTDISDPAHPHTVSQFGLQINDPKNCKEQLDSKANQSVHYHDVDDPTDTTFVMASMWNAGIRVFDVRNPAQPAEVAYFNPGDVDPSPTTTLDHAWAHIRYVAKTGEIWFATANGGFWVARIEGQVRNYLKLDAKNVRHGLRPLNVPLSDRGAPGTVGATLAVPRLGYIDATPYYCTLSAVTAPIRSS
jgi:hypothetical protein